MTKDEVLALAREGKAYIRLADKIGRFVISDRDPSTGESSMLVYVNMSDEDGFVYEHAAFESEHVSLQAFELTEDECQLVADAIEESAEE
jgi:hypothetical protein